MNVRGPDDAYRTSENTHSVFIVLVPAGPSVSRYPSRLNLKITRASSCAMLILTRDEQQHNERAQKGQESETLELTQEAGGRVFQHTGSVGDQQCDGHLQARACVVLLPSKSHF